MRVERMASLAGWGRSAPLQMNHTLKRREKDEKGTMVCVCVREIAI